MAEERVRPSVGREQAAEQLQAERAHARAGEEGARGKVGSLQVLAQRGNSRSGHRFRRSEGSGSIRLMFLSAISHCFFTTFGKKIVLFTICIEMLYVTCSPVMFSLN